ncbi:MAG: hypothetical protein AB7E70_19585 [Hyphomicrobiaceae bacterium]
MAKGKKLKTDDGHCTIRVPREAYDRAQRLLTKAANGGWAAFGVSRDDRPTLGTLIDESLIALEAKTS